MTAAMTSDELLLAFHAEHAGLTARAFAGGRLADGRSSYDLLAGVPRRGDAVLDLGCGDGYLLEKLVARGLSADALVGVDMSPHELDAARSRPALAGVRLLQERGSALSVADDSVDCVVSHLAFMLMSDIEAVAAEIARVLRSGGRFATVTGGSPPDDEADGFALFLRLFHDTYAGVATRAPRLGDKRTRHGDGIAELLPGDFRVTDERHDLSLAGTAEEVWEIVSTVYEMFVVAPDAVADLRARFLAEAGAGVVPCTMCLRFVVAERAP